MLKKSWLWTIYTSDFRARFCFKLVRFDQNCFVFNHRYERDADCSRSISSQKIHINKTNVPVAGTNKAGRLTGQAGQVQRCTPSTANIFAAATNRTNRQYMTLSINNVFVLSYQLKQDNMKTSKRYLHWRSSFANQLATETCDRQCCT